MEVSTLPPKKEKINTFHPGHSIVQAFTNLYSYLTFSYVSPLLDAGNKKELHEESALPLHPHLLSTETLAHRFLSKYTALMEAWGPQKSAEKNIVWHTLYCQLRGRVLCNALWIIIRILLRLAAPFFLREFLIWIKDYQDNKASYCEGWLWGSLMFLSTFLAMMVQHRAIWQGLTTGYYAKISALAAAHSKMLKLSSSSVAKVTTGHIINLVSNDLKRFEIAFVTMPYLILGPLEAIAVLIMVSYVLNIYSALAGLSCILLLIPLQSMLSTVVATIRKKTATQTDKRLGLMGELLNGILAIKMLSWEDPMIEKINESRSVEHQLIKRVMLVRANVSALNGYVQGVMVCLTFLVYRFTGDSFNVPDVFFAISLFALPKMTMTALFAFAVMNLSELAVTTRRLDAYFKIPETNLSLQTGENMLPVGEVMTKGGDYGWHRVKEEEKTKKQSFSLKKGFSFRGNSKKETESTKPELVETLTDINLHIKAGELVGVVGKVGSGKSSLLSALLNDMENLNPNHEVQISGKVAYCGQIPWIMAATVRENIILGKTYDPDFYHRVVASCALEVDFEQFPFGDETLLGERGINLSGGQKARIALARAAYHQADINLLDDPLSAVDSKVGRILFEKCISGRTDGLMKKSTRLLVTHQRQYLPFCDRIVLMNDGKIQTIDTWDKLSTHPLLQIMEETQPDVSLDDATENQVIKHEESEDTSPDPASTDTTNKTQKDDTGTKEKGTENPTQIVQSEQKELGKVALYVYWKYIRHVGFIPILLAFFVLIISKVMYFVTEWWIAEWASADEKDQKEHKWFWVLIAFTGGVVFSVTLAVFSLFGFLLRGSTSLHTQMVKTVTHAPLKFFHTNPVGRVLNRFAKDLGLQDEELPAISSDVLMMATQLLGTVVLVSIAIPYMMPLFLLIIYLLMKVQKRYIKTSREAKRYDGTTRSPIYAMFSNNLKGLSTIRAFGEAQSFQETLLKAVNLNGSWWLAFFATSRWYSIRLDGITSSVTLGSIVIAIIAAKSVSQEVLALALTNVVSLAGVLQWCMRQMAELENALTAVERNLEYTRLEQEPPRERDGGGQAPEDWPVSGTIEYHSVKASYRPGLDPVLKDLSFVIPGGSSVGIVGRTGSGKSSLLLSLFRLIDINEGQILLDNVDTSKIGIDALRKQLAVIPQDPVLFGGTIRSNLDPWNEFSDAQIWKVLSNIHLEDVAKSHGGLNTAISEGGGNLSVGQRQLMCLARALLTNCKVLALDEATANVDRATDVLIQDSLHALKTNNDKTLLIIAHRIDTVMDCDLLLVLDHGMKVEFGSPSKLLSKQDGIFKSMVNAAKKASSMRN